MTCGVIKLTAYGREQLSTFYTFISLILCGISVALLGNSLYMTIIVAPNLHSEQAAIRLIFTVIAMLSLQLVLYYFAGIFICHKCHREAYKKNSRYLLRIWIFSGYSSVLNVVIISTMASGVSNHLVRSMHHSMERGMNRYLTDAHWKSVIDQMQYKLECCGSSSFQDWHHTAWMSTSHILNASTFIGEHPNFLRISGTHIFVQAVPWSCCRLNYPRQCFHDPIQQQRFLKDWDLYATASIYNIGCVEKLKEPLEDSFLFLILAAYTLLLLQIILSVLNRYLYTSYKNAVILGDPFGTAPGWLFTPDKYFRHRRRSTSSEIVQDNNKMQSTSSPSVKSSEEEMVNKMENNQKTHVRTQTIDEANDDDDEDNGYSIKTEDEETSMIR